MWKCAKTAYDVMLAVVFWAIIIAFLYVLYGFEDDFM